MPVVAQQNLIEQSDFSGGFAPDGEEADQADGSLKDSLNLILDQATHALQTRSGFTRAYKLSGLSGLGTHYVRNVNAFAAPGGARLMVVVTDGSASSDNVGLVLVNLEAGTFARVDTPGRTWANPKEHHWGIGIDGVWYGGVRGEPMYSYDTLTSTWNADASVNPDWKELIDDVNDGISTATEYARDHAFKGHEKVIFDGDVYTPSRSIRFDKWDDDEKQYQVGDKVSRWAVWDSTEGYPKSFKCTVKHDPSDSAKAPGTGADWRDYWTKIRLPLPSNTDDGRETNESWYFVPTAAETSIAAWYGDRLFMRWDDEKDRSRLLFSAPLKPDKKQDVPDVVFDPTDFAPGNDFKGGGGGWIPFNDGTHHGFITALRPYNDRLLVFKRQAVWALVGTDDQSWATKRVHNGIGCTGPRATAEVNGLVYFLSDEGLWVTDGQEAREAPGNEKLIDYLRTRMDASLDNLLQYPVLTSFDGFILISIPDTSHSTLKNLTLFYEPTTGSFWPTNLPVMDMARARVLGVNKLYFAPNPFYGEVDNSGTNPMVMLYGGTTDHDGSESGSTAAIAWNALTNWWSFGLHRAERRIRRTWALVRGASSDTITITPYRNYSASALTATNRSVTSTNPTHYEGAWFADSHAVRFKLSGTKASSAVFGIAVETQPRRLRYHTG